LFESSEGKETLLFLNYNSLWIFITNWNTRLWSELGENCRSHQTVESQAKQKKN